MKVVLQVSVGVAAAKRQGVSANGRSQLAEKLLKRKPSPVKQVTVDRKSRFDPKAKPGQKWLPTEKPEDDMDHMFDPKAMPGQKWVPVPIKNAVPKVDFSPSSPGVLLCALPAPFDIRYQTTEDPKGSLFASVIRQDLPVKPYMNQRWGHLLDLPSNEHLIGTHPKPTGFRIAKKGVPTPPPAPPLMDISAVDTRAPPLAETAKTAIQEGYSIAEIRTKVTNMLNEFKKLSATNPTYAGGWKWNELRMRTPAKSTFKGYVYNCSPSDDNCAQIDKAWMIKKWDNDIKTTASNENKAIGTDGLLLHEQFCQQHGQGVDAWVYSYVGTPEEAEERTKLIETSNVASLRHIGKLCV